MQQHEHLLTSLRSALGVLELDKNSQLYRDVTSICDYLENPTFRIAVFGPFNYGKSTLINALLGNRALPIDIIPTTGAAIHVKYGNDLQTRIILLDGKEIIETGTEILQQFAILDGDRRMRDDVASVEVFCPHPFLQMGIELLDLPGTNDRVEQDTLIRHQLLSADLIIQVLDARQLMTLKERENLRDWLLDRGIQTIIFVVNFLNLIEPQEQKSVYNRLLFVAESFRANLPPGFSNLYRVDALPALRSRIKGDVSAAHSSGLVSFESALQNIIAIKQEKMDDIRIPRVVAIATQIQQALQAKTQAITTELETAQSKYQAKIDIQQKAEKLIKQGFATSVNEFRNWLTLSTILERYQLEVTAAIEQNQLSSWEINYLKPTILKHQQLIQNWINQACEFFAQNHPDELLILLPTLPEITPPSQPKTTTNAEDLSDVTPVAVATGLGWILGGPVGAAVIGGTAYLLNRNRQDEREDTDTFYQNQASQIYTEAAKDYLTRFSTQALINLSQYEQKAENVICFKKPEAPLESASRRHHLNLLHACLENLDRELETISASLG